MVLRGRGSLMLASSILLGQIGVAAGSASKQTSVGQEFAPNLPARVARLGAHEFIAIFSSHVDEASSEVVASSPSPEVDLDNLNGRPKC